MFGLHNLQIDVDAHEHGDYNAALLAAVLCFVVASRASLARSGKEWHGMPFGNSFHSVYTSQNETECKVEPLEIPSL